MTVFFFFSNCICREPVYTAKSSRSSLASCFCRSNTQRPRPYLRWSN